MSRLKSVSGTRHVWKMTVNHTCSYETLVYEHGTHFVLPESLLRMALPLGLKFVLRFIFRAAKEYPDECEAARRDIDRRLSAALKEWREEKMDTVNAGSTVKSAEEKSSDKAQKYLNSLRKR